MLDKIVRCLGLGSHEAPYFPGMQVVDWRVDELKSGDEVVALCHKNAALFVASCNRNPSEPDSGSIHSINLTTMYPRFNAQFALYREKDPKDDICVKRTRILELVDDKCMYTIIPGMTPSYLTTHEASICDRLSLENHPNLVHYLGVQVSDELGFEHKEGKIQVPLAEKSVTGLVFKKYDCTLDELVIRRQKFDIKLCLKSISAAIQHLHTLGLVHGDLSPHNVFVKRGTGNKGDHFVLGGFGYARKTGRVITFRNTDNRWSRRTRVGHDLALEDDDWYAFRRIIEWLLYNDAKAEDCLGIQTGGR